LQHKNQISALHAGLFSSLLFIHAVLLVLAVITMLLYWQTCSRHSGLAAFCYTARQFCRLDY